MVASVRYEARIDRLAARYRRNRAGFAPPAEPPDAERAMGFLREGVGPAIMVYVDGRTGGDPARFSRAGLDRLEATLNGYLELYAACYGADIDADASVRQAAELLLDTHNVADVAAMLTHVPARGTADLPE
jgi:hypothetical protein